MKHIILSIILSLCCLSAFAQLGIQSFVRPSCATCADGSITAMASGPAGPFTFQWSGTGGFSSTNKTISNLQPGSYTVIITNRFGCFWSFPIELGPCSTNERIQFDDVILIHCLTNTSADGSINLSVTNLGTGTLLYTWKKDGTPFGTNTPYLTGLSPGTYSVVISNGCTSITRSFVVKTCVQNEGPRASIDKTLTQSIDCDEFGVSTGGGGQLAVIVDSEFGPFTYEWSGPNGFTSTQRIANPLNGAGKYCVTVTDKCGRSSYACQDISCCEIAEVPYAHASYPCLGSYSGFFGGWNSTDGIITIIPPYYHTGVGNNTHQNFPCNKNYDVIWPDQSTSSVVSGTGWVGATSFTVSDPGTYSVTVSNQCGCSRVSSVRFESPSLNSWGNPNTTATTTFDHSQFYNAITNFLTIPTNADQYWLSLNPDVITSCASCKTPCLAETNCSGDDYQKLVYNNPNGTTPCVGGAIVCPTGITATVNFGAVGHEFIDFDATPTPIGNDFCSYPVGCLFEPGSLTGLSGYVFVENSAGYIQENADCKLPPPEIDDPNCGEGGVTIYLGYNKKCETVYTCSNLDQNDENSIMVIGTWFEDPTLWEYCACAFENQCLVLKRCVVANEPDPPFSSHQNSGCYYWANQYQISTTQSCDSHDACNATAKDPEKSSTDEHSIPRESLEQGFSVVESPKIRDKSLHIFPNPTSGEFTIAFPNIEFEEQVMIVILDNNGKLVFKTTMKELTRMDYLGINSNNLNMPPGVYHVQAHFKDKIETAKLVKSE